MDVVHLRLDGRELVIGRFSRRFPKAEFYLHMRPASGGGVMDIAARGLPSGEEAGIEKGLRASHGNCKRLPGGYWRTTLDSTQMQGLSLPILMKGLQSATDVWATVQAGEVRLYGETDNPERVLGQIEARAHKTDLFTEATVVPFPADLRATLTAPFST